MKRTLPEGIARATVRRWRERRQLNSYEVSRNVVLLDGAQPALDSLFILMHETAHAAQSNTNYAFMIESIRSARVEIAYILLGLTGLLAEADPDDAMMQVLAQTGHFSIEERSPAKNLKILETWGKSADFEFFPKWENDAAVERLYFSENVLVQAEEFFIERWHRVQEGFAQIISYSSCVQPQKFLDDYERLREALELPSISQSEIQHFYSRVTEQLQHKEKVASRFRCGDPSIASDTSLSAYDKAYGLVALALDLPDKDISTPVSFASNPPFYLMEDYSLASHEAWVVFNQTCFPTKRFASAVEVMKGMHRPINTMDLAKRVDGPVVARVEKGTWETERKIILDRFCDRILPREFQLGRSALTGPPHYTLFYGGDAEFMIIKDESFYVARTRPSNGFELVDISDGHQQLLDATLRHEYILQTCTGLLSQYKKWLLGKGKWETLLERFRELTDEVR
jgi:hypothetical protein